jgi:hypothetical protein
LQLESNMKPLSNDEPGVASLGSGRSLCVDGHEFPDPESNWMGDGQFPPFAIFDIDAQENLQPYYLTRTQAETAMTRILAANGSPE